jgi:UDP-glucuronate 4-epimerase
VLVTGAAGFIGSHCCRGLLDAGYEVVGLDNFDPFYDRRVKEAAIAELSNDDAFEFFEGDIRDQKLVSQLMETADVVLHLAARAGVRPSIEEPALYASINVEGTTNLLECARNAGVSRFVFGSSSSVYGDSTPAPFSEDAPALDPISPYAATKRAGELLCQTFSHLYGLRVVALRFFTVYGPRQRPDLAIYKFTRKLSAGEAIEQYGDGSAERDHTHVSDIVQGVTAAVELTASDRTRFDVINLGESRTIRLDRLIELIAGALGVEPKIERLPMQAGDVRRTCADIGKARRVLGYDPQVRIEDGIAQFVTWYEETYGRQSRATA